LIWPVPSSSPFSPLFLPSSCSRALVRVPPSFGAQVQRQECVSIPACSFPLFPPRFIDLEWRGGSGGLVCSPPVPFFFFFFPKLPFPVDRRPFSSESLFFSTCLSHLDFALQASLSAIPPLLRFLPSRFLFFLPLLPLDGSFPARLSIRRSKIIAHDQAQPPPPSPFFFLFFSSTPFFFFSPPAMRISCNLRKGISRVAPGDPLVPSLSPPLFLPFPFPARPVRRKWPRPSLTPPKFFLLIRHARMSIYETSRVLPPSFPLSFSLLPRGLMHPPSQRCITGLFSFSFFPQDFFLLPLVPRVRFGIPSTPTQ